eukprot:TRINITY_DN105912_c0_g1_i1.p1 TRINITY_DN105912_c0_g1~~TRINITY_DN105912_c0_g1_i1.p1  ORF type:complete len:341 (+),score=92.19 TRINITY_DN105912_c0_g1_i1:35-1024(+)
MPPKRRASSCPKGKAKTKVKAPNPDGTKEDPRAALLREAEQIFESRQPEGKLDGALKLAQFVEVVRSMNDRLCMIWGDDPVATIKREWANSGGQSKRELNLAEFKEWWVAFYLAAKAEQEEQQARMEAQKAAQHQRRAEMFSGDIWKIGMKNLPEAMQEARNQGKTPLILDNTPSQRVEAYFTYSDAHIIECKRMIVEKAKGEKTAEEVMESERHRFFSGRCFRNGKTVCFRMANTACDLKGMFNCARFPSVALLDAGQVQAAKSEEGMKSNAILGMAVGQVDELELAAGLHDDFNVVVISQFTPENFEEFLKDALPLELLKPMLPCVD